MHKHNIIRDITVMAARKNVHHNPETIQRIRESIQAQKIVQKLEQCILDDRELTNQQVRAAATLLGKVLPDLSAADIVHRKEQTSPQELLAKLRELGLDQSALGKLEAEYQTTDKPELH